MIHLDTNYLTGLLIKIATVNQTPASRPKAGLLAPAHNSGGKTVELRGSNRPQLAGNRYRQFRPRDLKYVFVRNQPRFRRGFSLKATEPVRCSSGRPAH
jgi:hypothetical protein